MRQVAGEKALIVKTHLGIDRRLCGEPLEITPQAARVAWVAPPETAVDGTGLVHGGFLFGLADHAAMLAVNHPYVVLAGAEVRFQRPVAVGERLEAAARLTGPPGRKSRVDVLVTRGEEVVMSATLTCVTLDGPALPERR